MSTFDSHRSAPGALYAGLILAVGATLAPYVDRAAGNVLADHVRDGYPTYSAARVDTAVTTWLAILTSVGILGIACWIVTLWAARTGKSWTRPAAVLAFALGTAVALAALLTKDTSGEVGLAPLLGWIGLLPSVAGLVAVVQLWRR